MTPTKDEALEAAARASIERIGSHALATILAYEQACSVSGEEVEAAVKAHHAMSDDAWNASGRRWKISQCEAMRSALLAARRVRLARLTAQDK